MWIVDYGGEVRVLNAGFVTEKERDYVEKDLKNIGPSTREENVVQAGKAPLQNVWQRVTDLSEEKTAIAGQGVLADAGRHYALNVRVEVVI